MALDLFFYDFVFFFYTFTCYRHFHSKSDILLSSGEIR